jgi:hypothetical protein
LVCALALLAAAQQGRSGSASERPQLIPSDVATYTRANVASYPHATTLSGTTNLTTMAFDDIAVAGVQFLLNGANLGPEDTTEPFSLSWDTTTVPNGTYSLAARARDAAGNVSTSAPITVIVQNNTPAPTGLVAAYSFNEGGGLTAADASPTANHATLTGATWAAGQYATALSITGTAYAEAADHNALTLGAQATWAAWVYLTSTPTELVSIANKWSQTGDDEFLFGLDSSRRLFMAWQTGAGGAPYGSPAFNDLTVSTQVALTTWTHIAVVRNGQTLQFYVNGVLSSSQNVMDTNPFRNGVNSLRIGGQNRGGVNRNFPGRIDDLRIYNRALTATDVQAAMKGPIGPPADTTPPSVDVTSPTGGTVSSIISVQATATDNVGVVGVQFKLDGANLGSEDTTSPYMVTWDTRTATNAQHALTAVARDAAGNTTTSAARQITVSNVVAPTGLVAAYGFAEGTGTTAMDSSPARNHATLTNATWAAGPFNTALAANGAGYAVASDRRALTPSTTATFEAWVYLTSTPTELASILNKWSQGTQDEYLLSLDANRVVGFGWKTTAGSNWGTPSYNYVNSTGQVPLNTWTHIAVVRNGATLSFYVNGTLASSSAAMDTNPFRNGSNSLRIGAQQRGGMTRNFPGRIDEVRIYNRALTQGEIQTNMKTPVGGG